jgi:hypothetical protein
VGDKKIKVQKIDEELPGKRTESALANCKLNLLAFSKDRSHITSYRTSTSEDYFLDDKSKAEHLGEHPHIALGRTKSREPDVSKVTSYRTSTDSDYFL